jgi:hypothetical protein
MAVRYGGLEGRTLGSALHDPRLFKDRETLEPEVHTALVFRLGAVESLIVPTVKKLCEPLFGVFNFATFQDNVYQQIVNDFVNRKVS